MKTTFASGVIVTSEWLNGAKRLFFDGQDLDWHYNPLGLESLVTSGPNGLDNRYITLGTNQPGLSSTDIYITGFPISGNKVVTGKWTFGFNDTANPEVSQLPENAPLSYLTNIKYNFANGVSPTPSIPQKYAALTLSDLITKKVLIDQFDTLVIDNGEF